MKRIVGGCATGILVRSYQPINFLGMINKDTGTIQDKSHDLYHKNIQNAILAFPYGIGSSVGAYTIHSMKTNSVAPAAMLCERADLTVATGCALANIPMAILDESEMKLLQNDTKVTVDTNNGRFLPQERVFHI